MCGTVCWLSSMSLKRIVVGLLLCSLGCIYQIYHISDLFFEFSTTTKVSIARQTISYVPTLVVCTNFSNVLDPPTSDFLEFRIKTRFDKWFDRTPGRSNMIERASYFANSTSWTVKLTKPEFYSLYHIGKLIKRSEVCYLINRNEPFEFNYRAATSTTGDPILVNFIFNSSFLVRETTLNFFIHAADSSFHGISNSLAAVHFAQNSVNDSVELHKVILTYAEYQNLLLPAPYDSNCYDYRPLYKSERHCYDECHLNQSLEIHERIPMSVIKEQRINAMIYGKGSEMTIEARKVLSDIKKNCTLKCQKTQCNNDDFVPVLIHSIPQADLEVTLQASPDPLFKTIYEPKIYSIDFVTYVLSCFGFWFGLSCFNIIEKSMGKLSQVTSFRKKKQRNSLFVTRVSKLSVRSKWSIFHDTSLECRIARLEKLIHDIVPKRSVILGRSL